uniref:Uncharacterized protein n=1 Tax=Lygus hesperus TaxID=30085 RepID=A0A146LZ22_LYGHE
MLFCALQSINNSVRLLVFKFVRKSIFIRMRKRMCPSTPQRWRFHLMPRHLKIYKPQSFVKIRLEPVQCHTPQAMSAELDAESKTLAISMEPPSKASLCQPPQ